MARYWDCNVDEEEAIAAIHEGEPDGIFLKRYEWCVAAKDQRADMWAADNGKWVEAAEKAEAEALAAEEEELKKELGQDAEPPPERPAQEIINELMARYWDCNVYEEEAIAAIHEGEPDGIFLKRYEWCVAAKDQRADMWASLSVHSPSTATSSRTSRSPRMAS